MIVKATVDVDLFREAGKLAGETLEMLMNMVQPGITTLELDAAAEKMIRSAGHIPTFKGYRNFPATICASVNEEVVHGIPNKQKVLKEGDIISMDIGVSVVRAKGENFIGDTAVTVPVGKIPPRLEKLLADTRDSLYAGIKAAKVGASLDDIGGAVEDIGKANNYGIVREYGGHGIGYNYHEDPIILNYRTNNKTKLKAGMVIAIEPMFNLGGDRVRLKSDNWTVVTTDYKPSAHFEHSLLIIEGQDPEILTRRPHEVI
jgi:methionyl aminopeptidase